ncbi:hypothetical protein [Haloferula rosea]|uniref:Uncharacterized protein n=1 Tax=Haloferula rosea TaxID=490093 RepID=A0A934R8W7_9BACT|nr:hypothetical protein [Haloferula rosea]MBK1827384.1 hypothetical protein [Haloferula rosea]
MRTTRVLALIAVIGLLGFGGRALFVAQFGIHLDADEFIEMASDRDSIGSIHSIEYVGLRDGVVSLETWHLHRFPETIRYWTELEKLPARTQESIRRGAGRWVLGESAGISPESGSRSDPKDPELASAEPNRSEQADEGRRLQLEQEIGTLTKTSLEVRGQVALLQDELDEVKRKLGQIRTQKTDLARELTKLEEELDLEMEATELANSHQPIMQTFRSLMKDIAALKREKDELRERSENGE